MIPKPGKPPDPPADSFNRPISLLPPFSTIFEKLILQRLILVIEANIPNNQFGFLTNHKTILKSIV